MQKTEKNAKQSDEGICLTSTVGFNQGANDFGKITEDEFAEDKYALGLPTIFVKISEKDFLKFAPDIKLENLSETK